MSIGIRIRQARAAAKLTQTQLAEPLGITKQMVSHIETGRHAPTAEHIITICRVCNTSADFLLLNKGARDSLPPDVVEVARRILAMPREQRELLLQMFSGAADPARVEEFAKKPR